jgi:hypothetical protein
MITGSAVNIHSQKLVYTKPLLINNHPHHATPVQVMLALSSMITEPAAKQPRQQAHQHQAASLHRHTNE